MVLVVLVVVPPGVVALPACLVRAGYQAVMVEMAVDQVFQVGTVVVPVLQGHQAWTAEVEEVLPSSHASIRMLSRLPKSLSE